LASPFPSSSDDDAIVAARTFLRDRIDSTCVFELWQDQRFVACENDALIVELATRSNLVLPPAL